MIEKIQNPLVFLIGFDYQSLWSDWGLRPLGFDWKSNPPWPSLEKTMKDNSKFAKGKSMSCNVSWMRQKYFNDLVLPVFCDIETPWYCPKGRLWIQWIGLRIWFDCNPQEKFGFDWDLDLKKYDWIWKNLLDWILDF